MNKLTNQNCLENRNVLFDTDNDDADVNDIVITSLLVNITTTILPKYKVYVLPDSEFVYRNIWKQSKIDSIGRAI